VPLRGRIRDHPTHRVNGRSTVVEITQNVGCTTMMCISCTSASR
jgi:hypothetical protein